MLLTGMYIQKLFVVKFTFVNDKEYLLALNCLLNAACFGLSKLMDIVSDGTTCPRSAKSDTI